MQSDTSIIQRSRADPAVFAELYDRYAVTIHRYAARRIGDAADDVMSETFLVAFERRGDFDPDAESALPWLYGIASTLIRKHARLEAQAWRSIQAGAGIEQTLDELTDADARLDARVQSRAIAGAMRRMPAGDREVLLLFAWQDLAYHEIAAALRIPVGTVRSRLNRARRRLREALERAAPSPASAADIPDSRPPGPDLRRAERTARRRDAPHDDPPLTAQEQHYGRLQPAAETP